MTLVAFITVVPAPRHICRMFRHSATRPSPPPSPTRPDRRSSAISSARMCGERTRAGFGDRVCLRASFYRWALLVGRGHGWATTWPVNAFSSATRRTSLSPSSVAAAAPSSRPVPPCFAPRPKHRGGRRGSPAASRDRRGTSARTGSPCRRGC